MDLNKFNIFLAGLLPLLLIACTPKLEKIVLTIPDTPHNIMIHSSGSILGPCEPTICIDPSQPSRIVAGSVLDNVYVSNDGGRTWDIQRMQSSKGVYGDPVVRIDREGNIFYAHLSNPKGKPHGDDSFLDRIVVQRSEDGGKTWNDGGHSQVRGSHDQDKEWLYIDPIDGTILMGWTEFDKYNSSKPEDKSRILFSKSTDKGDTWSEPIIISQYEGNCLDDDMTPEGAVPVVGTDGTYYIVWAFDSKIYLDISKDQGNTWLDKDRVIASQVNGWAQDIPGLDRCNGMPTIKCDISMGPYRGRLYVNWSDQRNGEDDTDIWVMYSDDRGVTWSAPHRVNDDEPGRHQFFSNMDVDPVTGFIYLVFYDRRGHDNNATDVFLAYSTDGGATFTNRKINSTTFTPQKSIFFGDYTDISAYNNMVRPIWTQYNRRQLSVWTALIDISIRD